MDFSLILFLLVCATGLIWALDRWIWADARNRAAEAARRAGGNEETVRRTYREPVVVEYARAFFPVILVVFLLRSFIVEPFRIPSGSMLPSLFIGDFILVNKFDYGIRLPLVNTKIIDIGAPTRGDVAVFRFPGDPSVNYIKRVVGVPGDVVVYKDKKVYVNGKPMEQTDGMPYAVESMGEQPDVVMRYVEHLGRVNHYVLLTDRPERVRAEFKVPPRHYFVMGDNRDRSNDSRYWGFVPDQNLVGKAFLIWFSWDMTHPHTWFWQRIVWSRIGTTIN